ncbi:hypothetical protein ABVC73_11110 [Prevotella melaninogenica]
MISEETDKELPYLPSILFHKVRTSCLFRAQIVMALWKDMVCLYRKTLIGKPYCKRKLQYGSPFIYPTVELHRLIRENSKRKANTSS